MERMVVRTQCNSLDQMNQLIVQNGATAGDNADGASLRHNGKRLDTVELLANMGGESKTWNLRTLPLS